MCLTRGLFYEIVYDRKGAVSLTINYLMTIIDFINCSFNADSDSGSRWLTTRGVSETSLLCSISRARDSIFWDFLKSRGAVGIFVSRRSSFERKLSGRILLFHMPYARVCFLHPVRFHYFYRYCIITGLIAKWFIERISVGGFFNRMQFIIEAVVYMRMTWRWRGVRSFQVTLYAYACVVAFCINYVLIIK